jgi:four helix bundle protein
MSFGHERLDVYRAAIDYVGWAYRLCGGIKGHRNAQEQLLRAAQAIPLNIAEGNGKATDGDRRRYFEIARGSALECGAIQDVLEVCAALSTEENARAKAVLDRIVAMLTKLGRRGYTVAEEPAGSAEAGMDSDTDADSDPVGAAGDLPLPIAYEVRCPRGECWPNKRLQATAASRPFQFGRLRA